MSNWKQPKRLQQRRHTNGRIAEVYLQSDGRFYAREYLANGEVGRSLQFRDNVPSLKLARLLADRSAHANCDGSCPPWQDDPDAVTDPECSYVLKKGSLPQAPRSARYE